MQNLQLAHSKYIPAENPWEPQFFGVFFQNGTVPCFVYETWKDLCLLPLTCDIPKLIHTNCTIEELPLPQNWIFLEHDDNPYLILKPNVIIDLLCGAQLSYIPETLQSKCTTLARQKFYYSLLDYEFLFDDYCISRNGEFGYRCSKAGSTIWEFTGRAYLYTDYTRWNNRVFFGTAGHGGYFYVLDVDTGEAIANIKTSGTASIAQRDHLCYVVSNGSKRNSSKLLCVDLRNGHIIQELDLYGGVTLDSRLQIIGQYLHIVTFEYKGKSLQNAIWNMVDIS